MHLILARHGQTDWNIERRFLGTTDLGLNDEGVKQAKALATALPAGIDVIVSSPLLRAAQTAGYAAEVLHLPVLTDAAFGERNVGVFEGLTLPEILERYPQEWERKVARQWDLAPAGGENIEQVFVRVSDGINRLLARYEGKTVLLVAHAFVGRVVQALHHPVDAEGFFAFALENAQWASYQRTDRVPDVAGYRQRFLARAD
ncbi:Phosphoserine phosphatase 1 [Andreprevotia sp. IGB-42]|uniref:histidine phosphatase family protein n=1 Tax=Andreprevotia sp. IGB-42 TaxID=2497473 RepID=UPI001358C899|nr:histidine phosphatase family protein [Andreprevotia sp. IGB-42]KAF0815161.1 Phosphoserine phosphatase 1 [Andreprevotia sp. IGB-42]